VRRARRGRARVTARLGVALVLASAASARADNPAEVFELPRVDVVGTTPLPGLGTPLRDVPANVQVFGAPALARQRSRTLTQFLEQNGDSVGAAGAQGNPWQSSLDFRGFTASPLLGAPQGLSVFQDGVRINEAFGDVVNWDLVPRNAIASVQLIPGSVAPFGLNTLGGALAIYTKSGAQFPGARASAQAGSFGARSVDAEVGGVHGRLDGFLALHAEDDRGWAAHNPSRVRQLFGKVGFQDDLTDLDATVTLADNALEGTQTLPLSLSSDPRQAYTWPDRNVNRLAFVALKGSRFLAPGLLLGGNAYVRRYRTQNVSSNVNDDFDGDDDDAPPALNDRSTIDQRSAGAGLQLTWDTRLGATRHRIVAGASIDAGNSRFSQDEQPATFSADRGTQPLGPYAPLTDAALRDVNLGAYLMDTVALTPAWTLTASLRADHARVRIGDRSGTAPDLDGTHAFARVNPSLGATWNPRPGVTAYATWNEGMRAPTAIELTCADPAAPCKLPNEFLADPPLAKVVARTLEAGARGTLHGITWSAAAYRTDLRDDLQFVASGSGAANAGYFANVGRTRRQGVELGAEWSEAPWRVVARYHHLDATFRSAFRAPSPDNSTADAAGDIDVQPGDRIPGLPRDALKLRVEWSATGRLDLGLNLVAVARQYARGDENNADAHGPLPGYAVVHLDAEYRLAPRVTLLVQVDNLLDRRYATYALLGSNVFTGPGGSFGPAAGVAPVAEPFRAFGAPRAIYAGVRYALEPEPEPPRAAR
jgi:outer membrane receptor protein involved in Fe transport